MKEKEVEERKTKSLFVIPCILKGEKRMQVCWHE